MVRHSKYSRRNDLDSVTIGRIHHMDFVVWQSVSEVQTIGDSGQF